MNNKIYGVDLGTTNSLIGFRDKLIAGLVSSVADIKSGKAGTELKHVYAENISRSFKVNMSCGEEGIEPINASALVLKELVRQVKEKTGEEVSKVVISVPAYFTNNERTATVKAANKIGLDVVALINEPTAAAIIHNKDKYKITVVFDLGGGTFDVSVIDTRCSNYDVLSTDGYKFGGDNLDSNLRNFVMKEAKIVRHRIERKDLDLVKGLCEKAKIELQKTRQDVVIDLSELSYCCPIKTFTIKVSDYISIMKLTFKDAIILTKQVIASAILYEDPYDILLVGGSTRDPFLKEWVEEELHQKVINEEYNPDTIVALGACYFAQLVENGEADMLVLDVTKALSIGVGDGTVRTIISKDSKVPISDKIILYNDRDSDKLELSIYQGEGVFTSSNTFIGKMVFKYKEPMKAHEGQVFITLEVTMDGIVRVKAKEPLEEEQIIELSFKKE